MMDSRVTSVRRRLCDDWFICIPENRYVEPNTQRLCALWRLTWGVVSGGKRGNCAGPTVSHWAFNVRSHCSSISSVWICTGAVSTSAANGLRNSSELFFCTSKSPKRRANSYCTVCSASQQSVHMVERWNKLHHCPCVSHKRSFSWNREVWSLFLYCPWTDRLSCAAKTLIRTFPWLTASDQACCQNLNLYHS